MSESRTIATDTELFAAALYQAKVSVWQHTADYIPVLIEDGGVIEKITPISVKINGSYFMRSECEFRVIDRVIREWGMER